MKILGIETSCDETAAAVVENGEKLLSNVVASSVDLHKAYGGVVPEIAARSHIEAINPVVDQALNEAECQWQDIDAISVTCGPGLSGSLLIGVLAARTLAIVKNKPLFPINHVESHVYGAFIKEGGKKLAEAYDFPTSPPQFPLLALIVSGGHTQLVFFESHFRYKLLGKTLDDAVGEAFDKVAKIIGLPYPGGPSIEKAAKQGEDKAFALPLPKTKDKYSFSYSGLKTAVLRTAQKACGKSHDFPSYELASLLSQKQKSDLAASFQSTALSQLVNKTKISCDEYLPKTLIIAGGVAANSKLRQIANKQLEIPVICPDIKLCTDNGAMVAGNAYFALRSGQNPINPCELDINPGLSM